MIIAKTWQERAVELTNEGLRPIDVKNALIDEDYLVTYDQVQGYLYRQKFMSGGFENVGWSKPGHESLYNIFIMEELGTILATGGGASTKLVNRETGRIERIFNPKYPKEYIENIDSIIAQKAKIEEFYGE